MFSQIVMASYCGGNFTTYWILNSLEACSCSKISSASLVLKNAGSTKAKKTQYQNPILVVQLMDFK